MSHDTQVRPLRRPQRVPRARSASEHELELRPREDAAAAQAPPVDAHAPVEEQEAQQEQQPETASAEGKGFDIEPPRVIQLVAMMLAELQKEEANPLAANELAFMAGLSRIKLASRRRAAETEKRAVLALLVDQRVEKGQARTPAERDAKHDPSYIRAEERIAELEEQERLAELVQAIAFQRAHIMISRSANQLRADVLRSLRGELDADE